MQHADLRLHLLLTAADDAALARAVTAAGGTDAAIRLLLDAAHRLQAQGALHVEILTITAASRRVEALARRAR
jgi:hypothetical protein